MELVHGIDCDLCGARAPHPVIIPNACGTVHHMVECQECGLRFFDPRPSLQTRIEAFQLAGRGSPEHFLKTGSWPGHDTNPPDVQWGILRSFARDIYSNLQELLPSLSRPPSVYEVGPWIGWLLHELIQCGAAANSSGCDLNPHAVAVGAEAFNTNVEPLPFQDATPPDAPYDVVLLNDVIEHSWTPLADLTKARQIAPQGILYLKTFIDDLDIPLGRPMMAPPGHSYHFTRKTLRQAVEQAGWTVLRWVEEPIWAQVTLYAN